MNKTFVTILITALLTSLCWYVLTELRENINAFELMSAVKAPGAMAIDEIQADLIAGRVEVAKLKIAALKKQWAIFRSESGFGGPGIGNIMVAFGKIDLDTDDAMKAKSGHPTIPTENRGDVHR